LDANNNPVHTFEFEYDAASQLTNAQDPDSAYGYEYDQDGRVTSVDNVGTPDVPNVVLDYTYDPVDNLTQVKDSIDGVESGVETFGYDPLDRVTKITQRGEDVTEKRVDMTYDKASQMTGMTRYSDLAGTELVAQSNYTFDAASRLTDIVHEQNAATLAEFNLEYDQGDRITQFTTPDGVSDFTYDKTDQLVDAEHSYQDQENFTYDDNGNRTNTGYVTGDNNQLLSDGKFNYQYDKEGNRVKRTEIATGEVTNYEWDYRNRLVGVETKDSSGQVISNSAYTYDVFDNRIAKSVDADGDGAGVAKEEHFVYDGSEIALTFDGEGNQTERFLHGTQIDQVLAQENADGEVLWALTDNQGSVRMLLDNNGDVVNNITYSLPAKRSGRQ
jgi:YD repeat-containing protein